MKKISFPYEVKRGSVSIKIYKTQSHGCDSFVLSYYRDGVRKRSTFHTFKKALAEAEHIASIMASSTSSMLMLTAADGAAYQRARQLLDPLNIPIEFAAAQYAEAKSRLKNVPLAQVVDYYLMRHSTQIEPRTVSQVLDEMLHTKQTDGLTESYLRHLRYDLKKFSEAFSCNINMVSGTDADAWLRGLNVGPRTRNNIRTAIQTLFTFSKTKKYLPKDHDEIDLISIAKETNEEIELFTPDELIELLNHANEHTTPFLVIGAFAGVRHAEIQRLDWQDMHFDGGFIEIRAKMAKTASRRIIPMTENLKAWLLPHSQATGLLCTRSNMAHEISRLVKRINENRKANKIKEKFIWKHNALRHSFISYRIAQIQNMAQVALEAGNSPQMILKHYRELVRPKEAEAWFSIMPDAKNSAQLKQT